jgi:hypothetical protein
VDAARSGESIYFPAGRYRLGDRVAVRTSNLTLWGDGVNSVIMHGNITGVALGTGGQPLTGLVVKRLKFVGQPGLYKQDGNSGQGIQVYGPKGAVIQDCDFEGCGTAIFNAGTPGTTYGTRIENCRVNGWGTLAVFCNGGEQIVNCQFVQTDPNRHGERSSHGIYIHSGCDNVLVADTLIQNARKYGAQVYGQDVGTTTTNIVFRRVTMKDCANGLTIQHSRPDAAVAKDVVIEDCSITGTYAGPALSVKQGDGIQILNNLIDGGTSGLQLGLWAPYEPGFSIRNLRATGNVIRNCDRGIWGLASNGGTFSNVSVSGNTISNCRVLTDLSGARTIAYSP